MPEEDVRQQCRDGKRLLCLLSSVAASMDRAERASPDMQRIQFLERDNDNLLREIDALRVQIDALRARNRMLEDALESRTVYGASSGPSGRKQSYDVNESQAPGTRDTRGVRMFAARSRRYRSDQSRFHEPTRQRRTGQRDLLRSLAAAARRVRASVAPAARTVAEATSCAERHCPGRCAVIGCPEPRQPSSIAHAGCGGVVHEPAVRVLGAHE